MKKIKLLVLCMLVFIMGCGSKKVEEKKLTDVSIVLDWYPNAIHSLFYVAMEKGYFKEEGINLEIKYPANVSDPIALPAAGKADLGLFYPQQMIMAKSQEDIPVISIGALTQGPLNVVVSPKENGITRPRDLEGKTIGYSDGPLTEDMLKTMVAEDGGDISKVKVLDVGFDLLSSMITKRVDATLGCFVNHEVPVMKEKGVDVNYFYPTDFGVPYYNELLIVANSKKVKENKELYLGFLRACEKGFRDVKNNPEEALDILLANQEADQFPLTRGIEKQSLQILLPIMEKEDAPFLDQKEKVWQENIDWLYDKKIINKKMEAKDIFINLYKEM
ncbi:MAG: ABC transporter substrate-binding protein [Fusobacterium sp. JB021]|nr:ABC transporter substrate-binding protein [Fusobacterium sp. JB021]MDP0506518.1 ABC transporter substrate-binding protein [Fusobacterium sp. JB019]MDP0506525.1 ABC transporter substrate-binding protein [Fusobacterium sp. JB019]